MDVGCLHLLVDVRICLVRCWCSCRIFELSSPMDVGCLHAVLLLELDVLLPEGVDSVDHALHELDLGVAEAVLVGDVVGVAGLSARLSPGAPGLHLELLAPRLELVEALMPVPRLVGQEWMYPNLGEIWKSFPDSALTDSWTALMPRARRSKTPLTSPPFCMEMILSWSSSLTQTRKVLSALWKMPLPSGQSRSMPATFRLGSPDMKRKWSSTSC